MRLSAAELRRQLGVGRRFTIFLTAAGFLGAIALAAPSLVMLGFFAGILPGIVLFAAPSAFLYMLAWYCVFALPLVAANVARIDPERWIIRFLAGTVAAAIVAVVAVAVPRSINASIEQVIAEFRTDDRDPATPIVFPPVVAVVLAGSIDKQPGCDTLCQRLLYNGVVSKVVMADVKPRRNSTGTPIAYWIERREACPQPVLRRPSVVWPSDFRQRAGAESRTRARVAAGECLVSGPALVEEAQVTVDFRSIKKGSSPLGHSWSLTLDTVNVNRLEIKRANGEVLYRRTEAEVEPLVAPLLVEMRAGFMTTVTYGGWARTKRIASQLGPQGREVLPALLGDAAHMPDAPPDQR
jgi:hypothetical protein